jgi:hypothetical protein
MAILRERPYGQFNFLVDLGDGTTEGPQAGFQEVSGIGMEAVVIEYRNGNSNAAPVPALRAIEAMQKVGMMSPCLLLPDRKPCSTRTALRVFVPRPGCAGCSGIPKRASSS